MTHPEGSGAARAALPAALALLLILPLLPGCGKKGPPLPPMRVRPEAPRALELRQRGSTVWISLREPADRTDGSELAADARIRLFLLAAQAAGKPLPARRAGGPSWVIPRSQWPLYAVGGRIEIPLALETIAAAAPALAGPGTGERRIAFTAEIEEGKHRRSELARPVTLALCTAPAPPAALSARVTEPGILLEWDRPAAAGSLAHIYRSTGSEPAADNPHATPQASAGSWLDRSVAEGKRYGYVLRFASGTPESICESTGVDASAQVADTFPPAPPAGLAAAAEEGFIRLFWTPGGEPDLAGYLIYRRAGDNGFFELLTPDPLTETTWADRTAARGVRYSYAVTAIDGASPPNESVRSEEVTESIR